MIYYIKKTGLYFFLILHFQSSSSGRNFESVQYGIVSFSQQNIRFSNLAYFGADNLYHHIFNLQLLYYLLLRAGYRTLMAVDGPTALNMARFHTPDLIVLDIMIPGISGLDVTSVLKADDTTCDIPIVILSILADEEKAAQLGASACFSKPFDQDAFLARIAELLASPARIRNRH